MPFAAFLACCCQGAEASMPVAETKAPILTQTLGGQAGQSGGTEERAWVRENGVYRARVWCTLGAASGGSPGPLSLIGMNGLLCERLSVAPWYVW